MIRVSREIRFSLVPPQDFSGHKPANSWAGGPATNRLVPRVNLRCIVEGPIDPQTGYLCNIKLIDDLLRKVVTETLRQNGSNEFVAESFLIAVAGHCRQLWEHAATIVALELDVSSCLSWRITMSEDVMISMTEQFEFSAAHRLHCDDLTDDQNREIFGKCNHPGGHGHNYVIEVTLCRTGLTKGEQVADLDQVEATVNRLVIDRLDHKNLNVDEPHFQKVNPTVENIAVAIYSWLDNQFGGAKLKKVRVYETPKTWAEFPTG